MEKEERKEECSERRKKSKKIKRKKVRKKKRVEENRGGDKGRAGQGRETISERHTSLLTNAVQRHYGRMPYLEPFTKRILNHRWTEEVTLHYVI